MSEIHLSNKKIIYIRHGPDKESSYKNDEKLTSEGKRMCKEMAKDLIEKHGIPDIIYYSPFYRTRQTKKEMLKVIEKHLEENGIGKNIKTKIEPKLGRYFNKRERRYPDLHYSTIQKGALIHENHHEFTKRVEEQLEDIMDKHKYSMIWNITHTLVLIHIADFKEISHSSRIQYLDTILIEK